jgi:hypothetical protein
LRTPAASFEFGPSRLLLRLRYAVLALLLLPALFTLARFPLPGLMALLGLVLIDRLFRRGDPRGITLQLHESGLGVLASSEAAISRPSRDWTVSDARDEPVDNGSSRAARQHRPPQLVTLEQAAWFGSLIVLRLASAKRGRPLIVLFIANDAMGETAWRGLRRHLRLQRM